jgi:hypothetical protein
VIKRVELERRRCRGATEGNGCGGVMEPNYKEEGKTIIRFKCSSLIARNGRELQYLKEAKMVPYKRVEGIS